jgi:carbonic anhydrase
MSLIRSDSEHDTSYPPARGPVLLLSCMDLRLLDEIMQFMDQDGLTNRYDHVILAGAALGALGGGQTQYAHWQQTFFDHLQAAYELHRIKDVYIVEHRDCGAYRMFLGADGEFGDDEAEDEADCHRRYAVQLRELIEDWAVKAGTRLKVRSFLMGLRGRVELLDPPRKPKRRRKGRK